MSTKILKSLRDINKLSRFSRESLVARSSTLERLQNVSTQYTKGYNARLEKTLVTRDVAYQSIANSVPQANRRTVSQDSSNTVDWV